MSTAPAPTSIICPQCHKKFRFKKTPAESRRFQCTNFQGTTLYSAYDPGTAGSNA